MTYTHAIAADDTVAAMAAEYDSTTAAIKALTEHKNTLAAQLKEACEAAALAAGLEAGDTRVVLEGAALTVRTTPVETWRVDTPKLKAEQPHLYAAYAKMTTSTRLEVVPS